MTLLLASFIAVSFNCLPDVRDEMRGLALADAYVYPFLLDEPVDSATGEAVAILASNCDHAEPLAIRGQRGKPDVRAFQPGLLHGP